jgi:hypothetical protein
VPFLFDSLDLTNNILILKKQIPKGFDNWQQFQDAKKLFPFSLWDELPKSIFCGWNDFKGFSINRSIEDELDGNRDKIIEWLNKATKFALKLRDGKLT